MKQTDAERAYQVLKEKIVTVDLPPGSVISEAYLMDELGLGRTPIREALKQLQTEDLVVVTPRRGMYVSDIAITDLIKIHEVRIEVEANCARLAAKRITPGQVDQIKNLVNQTIQARYDMGSLISIDRSFHSLIAEAADNKFLYKDWEYYYNLSLRIWYLVLNYLQPGDVGVDDHTDILTAIHMGDVQKADQHMREHIDHFYTTVKNSL
jgi:DNA-binding GntR family transcriptional regulator